jgi:NTE family protein
VVFPMVNIDGELHCDGGLRMNTPTAPAIHLGARRLFVVGLSHRPEQKYAKDVLRSDRAPGAPFLFGKVLDAFFLDHVDADLREIQRVNEYLDMGSTVYGPSFLERMNAEAKQRGKPERSPIRMCVVRPSADLGGIAYEFFGESRRKMVGDTALTTALLRFLDVGEAAEADLASFLLFDEAYVRLLVELGRKDAADKRDQLEDFFFGS